MWLSISNYLSPHYYSIEERMCSDEQGQDLNSENKAPSWEKSVSSQGKPILSASLPWIILTFIFATLSAYLYFCSPTLSPLGTFENGFLTDFGVLEVYSTPEAKVITRDRSGNIDYINTPKRVYW